ncbi:MAG: cysteine--tRNA ligase [Candidatus Portnoybacteria bacterium RBG_13_41_18]|uniref:Cysteine--tRNA ligase n=1 Tax=Candidatus Portnoybacteria bacterium RBG_13_41_18 TaxID=1801991 RepID=A0A1G2F855_9BACT|nr:MAG: cysteine--tRNA ligase [Candidatus Portnoybacteria bacterium RBG_13_41_18]
MLKLYNTLTRQKEIFEPINDKKVGIYCCGPTVYWYAHIGNFRTYIFADILRRVLEFNDYQVLHIMNYTDVGHLTSDADTGEDKMEKGAAREGKTAWEIADFYIKAFEKDAEALNILKPDRAVRATDHIPEQIDLIKILEKKGYTYLINDGVYFDTSKLTDYGKLARLDIKGLKSGARIEIVEGKKNLTDFALWKLTPSGTRRQMEWDSPWGRGFPGWHIECSAMAKKYLGQQFDIHCGGIDHIPVHHTNEIAQSETAFGKVPARFWLHNEFLLVDSGKMSKSLGNIYTLEQLKEKGYGSIAFRYLNLTAHYRSKLNFTWESLEAAQSALDNLYDIYRDLKYDFKGISKSDFYKKYHDDFLSAINDDLNTPEALAIMWKLIKDEMIPSAEKKSALLDFDKIFGLGLKKIEKIEIPPEILDLANQREKLRQEKKWREADEIRKQIESEGWQIEDTKKGPEIVKL